MPPHLASLGSSKLEQLFRLLLLSLMTVTITSKSGQVPLKNSLFSHDQTEGSFWRAGYYSHHIESWSYAASMTFLVIVNLDLKSEEGFGQISLLEIYPLIYMNMKLWEGGFFLSLSFCPVLSVLGSIV